MAMNWRYRGPIETVEHAVQAHLRIRLTCQSCRRERIMSAFRLYMTRIETLGLVLNKPVAGFWCKSCHRSTKVVISTDQWRVY